MNNFAPIVPWIGGKRRLAKQLLPKFPDHQCYVEPFAGGAALFFLRDQPAKVEVLNDINGDLINLYRVVQHHIEEFVRQFKWALSSRQVFQWMQDQPIDPLTDIQRAARFYYLQQLAFGGKVHGQTFGTATTAPPISFCRVEETLCAAHLRLSGVTIEHLAWHECVKRYDRPHTFFFMDPPYWTTVGYGVDFGADQYEQMADMIGSLQGKAMITLNDHPDIRTVFSRYRMEEVSIRYSVGTGRMRADKRKELVIFNW